MKSYLKKFIHEEDGIETIEFIGMVAVAAALLVVVAKIGGDMKNTANNAQGEMNKAISAINGLGG